MKEEFKVGDVIKKTTKYGYVIGILKESCNYPFFHIEVIVWNSYLGKRPTYERGNTYTGINVSESSIWKVEKLTEEELVAWLI